MLQPDPISDVESEDGSPPPTKRSKSKRGCSKGFSKGFSLMPFKMYDDLDLASSASAENIELSEEEGEIQDEQHMDQLFPMDIFPRETSFLLISTT